MRHGRLILRQGREFVWLYAEGPARPDATEATRQTLAAFSGKLEAFGLSLDDTVRTRLWARDRRSRDLGSAERRRILSGPARSASSSYIAPERFGSQQCIALELLALKASSAPKICREFDPPKVPVRYIVYDAMLFLSGVTAVLPTLAEQTEAIVHSMDESLREAGSAWSKVVEAGFYLHRSQSVDRLRQLFGGMVKAEIPCMEYVSVDGYSAEGKLIEIEVTALL
jgi:enamine deaminase RidA (YjgF/YER057c/UK114 family)